MRSIHELESLMAEYTKKIDIELQLKQSAEAVYRQSAVKSEAEKDLECCRF